MARTHHDRLHNTSPWAILLVAASTLLIAGGQVLLKSGLGISSGIGLLTEYRIIAGVVLLAAAGLMIPLALKHGELSVLHPVIALGFVWVAIASIYHIKETVPWHHILGIVLIILGVSIIGGRRR